MKKEENKSDSNGAKKSWDIGPENPYYYELLIDKVKHELASWFGLSSSRIKVLLLLELYGSMTASEISKFLKLSRTETFRTLTWLDLMKLTARTSENPPKFSVLPLEKSIGRLINSEKERLKMMEAEGKNIVKLWDLVPKDIGKKECEVKL